MTSRERLEKCWAFETPDRVPFIPAVYEQKALSGPLSLALSLLSPEDFFMGTLDEPDYCQRVIAGLQDAGDPVCPLIIGGNTTRLADAYARTGSRQILCDFPADWNTYRQLCTDQRLAVRRNISPGDIGNGTPEALAAIARQHLADAGNMPAFILGTAVLPFGTPTRNVLAIRETVRG